MQAEPERADFVFQPLDAYPWVSSPPEARIKIDDGARPKVPCHATALTAPGHRGIVVLIPLMQGQGSRAFGHSQRAGKSKRQQKVTAGMNSGGEGGD